MHCNADFPLSNFLGYHTYGHMIENVVLIVTGLLRLVIHASFVSSVLHFLLSMRADETLLWPMPS
jgi:hypothetical protein